MPYESQERCLFPCGNHNYAKLANKTLEDLELGASGRTDEKQPTRKIRWILLSEAAKPGEFPGKALEGPTMRLAGTLSVRSCQQGF